MSESVIEVENLHKSFCLYIDRPETIKNVLINALKFNFKSKKVNRDVLHNLNFKIKPGEFVGIMGRNGSGKTTLLKLLSGIYKPTTGTIKIKEKLAPMVALGAGFQPELSGYDNIFLNAAILGFSRDETQQKIEEIINFSEIGDNVYRPVKNYSSGMIVRLGFSILSLIESPILLLDEILAVGDEGFQKKSMKKMEDIFKSGRTIILVTHDPVVVRKYCNRCIVIEDGRIIFDGDAAMGSKVYSDLF